MRHITVENELACVFLSYIMISLQEVVTLNVSMGAKKLVVDDVIIRFMEHIAYFMLTVTYNDSY